MEDIVWMYLTSLKLPVSKSYCESLIASHPDYPSILSIADLFELLDIEYSIRRIKKEDLNESHFPCLMPTKKDRGHLLFLKNIGETKSLPYFEQLWDGVVIQVDPSSKVNDSENTRIRKVEFNNKILAYISLVALVGLFAISITAHLTLYSSIFILTSIFGISIGYALVSKDIGIRNQYIEQLCGNKDLSGCDKILKSDGAQFFGISLSDAVLTYFCTQLILISLAVAVPSIRDSVTTWLGISSVLAIPTVVYSIIYQKVIAKAWCRLCLMVDALLVIQLPILSAQFDLLTNASLNGIYGIAALLLVVLIGSTVVLVKNAMKREVKTRLLHFHASRIKNNSSVFGFLLFQNRKIDDNSSSQHRLVLGQFNAILKITTAINLFCDPCKKHFQQILSLIEAFPDQIEIEFCIIKSGKVDENERSAMFHIINYWLEYIHNTPDEQNKLKQLLSSWFDIVDLQKFKLAYPTTGTHQDTLKVEESYLSWAMTSNVRVTPTIFLNGHEFPTYYDIDDLLLIVPGLLTDLTRHEILNRKNIETINIKL